MKLNLLRRQPPKTKRISRIREPKSPEQITDDICYSLLTYIARRGSSEVVLEPHEFSTHVDYRIDGVLHGCPFGDPDYDSMPTIVAARVVAKFKEMGGLDVHEKQAQSGCIRYQVGSHFSKYPDIGEFECFVSTSPTQWGESLHLKIFPVKPTLDA